MRPGLCRNWRTSWYAVSNYQKCTECNAFYILETHRSLSDCMNGHRFTTMVSNPDLPVAIHTQSRLIPFQECWSVTVIHKLPDSTPDTSAANLKLHTNLSSYPDTPRLNIRYPPTFHPRPSDTKSFASVSCILLLRKATVI